MIKDKKANDKVKEQVREEYLLDRETKKLIQDAERKLRDGWSTDHALKGLKADVSADCEMIPEGFTQESIKEERRLNGVMRQDLRYDIAVEGVCVSTRVSRICSYESRSNITIKAGAAWARRRNHII